MAQTRPDLAELIVYACPTGPLAEQLASYWQRSQQEIGPNQAHRYMPHCSLTGFFHDRPESIPFYTQTLENCYRQAQSSQPQPVFEISGPMFRPDFHGLLLNSEWIQAMLHQFAIQAESPSRVDRLRVKDGLHLSLAYGFAAHQQKPLQQLAQALLDPEIGVGWDLRFYQRHPEGSWTCHQNWRLESFQINEV